MTVQDSGRQDSSRQDSSREGSSSLWVGASQGIVRVLLVEDDKVDRMAFERLIQKQKLPFACTSVATLQEALGVLEGIRGGPPFDVVISDYNLPDGTALELLERGVDLPVIVITGAGGEEIAVHAMRAGAFDYLIKDLDRQYLKILPITVENALRARRDQEELRVLSHAVRNVNEAIYIFDLDGTIIYVNDAFTRTYGWSSEEVLGHNVSMLVAESEVSLRDQSADLPAMAGAQVEQSHRRRDGRVFPALVSFSNLYDERGLERAEVAVVWDISQRKRSEQALRESEERYALAARGANDGLWDWDLRTGEIYFSQRWKSMMGYSDEEIGGSLDDWLRLVHPEDVEHLQAHLEAHLSGSTPHFESEQRIRHKDGEYRWMLARGLAVRDSEGNVYRMAGSQTDITERKEAEQQLLHDAVHDTLTRLPNRALFLDRLGSALARAHRRPEYLFAVIFLDLDRFKLVNDSLGHMVGDELLVALGQRLAQCLRLVDTVARLGGDEFAVLIDDLDRPEDALEVSHRIQQELKRPFNLAGHEVFANASMGIALSSTGYERAEDVLRDADTAMYRAKAQPEQRPVVFDPAMHASAMVLLRLENDLRRAVDRGEFELYYQPIVSLEDRQLWGFEALVRWMHPERGLVSPGEFIPLAEETGLILEIGCWVLEEACRQTADWQQRLKHRRPVHVSVNVAAQQLTHMGFLDAVDQALDSSGILPGTLRLEITEGVMMESPELARVSLQRFRQREIKLHIDDFGTGYSSLSQLHTFPIDTLKIDRSFVANMNGKGENHAIVRTIVALAKTLNLEVMAEGIETAQQLQSLRSLDCEFGQGFLFSRPLPRDEAESLLTAEEIPT
ncbi:MAG: EAL domain-containing protein [Acidobacteriota bacterium]